MEIKKPLFPAAVITLGITSLLVGGKFPYFFFYLFTLLLLIPLFWLGVSLRRLKGSIEVPQEYGEVGSTLTVYYRLNNSPWGWFPYLELASMIGSSFSLPPEDKLFFLEPGDSAVYRCEVQCTRRGKYDLEAFRVKTGDPFGIFKLSRALSGGKEIKVYPKKRVFPRIDLPSRQHFGSLAVHNLNLENQTQVSDLRDWQPGDSAKKIHWKQSARQGKLVVKNYDCLGDAVLSIFIDMYHRNYRQDIHHALEDLAVEAAASLIFVSLKEGLSLQVFSEPLPEGILQGSQLRDYRRVMDSLITLSPRGQQPFAGYVNKSAYSLAPQSSLYLFTPCLDRAEGLMALDLKRRGFYPYLFHLALKEPSGAERSMLEKLKEAGIKTVSLQPEEVSLNAS